MKVRMQGNAIRFRLNRRDVAELAKAGQIQESVEFGRASGQRLVYAIEAGSELLPIGADYQEGRITVRISCCEAKEWIETERIGIDGVQALGNGRVLHILVEKDFQCLHAESEQTESEIDPEAYPNPLGEGNLQEVR